MNKKLFLGLAATLLCSATVTVAQTTFYVYKSGNDNNDGKTEATAFASVGKAVMSVKDNDETVIYLEPGAVFNAKEDEYKADYATYDFGENKNVTIIGDNTTLQGATQPGLAGEATRILRAATNSVLKLKGITLENGRQIDYSLGGAIYFAGELLEIENCRFINNEAGSGGAAIGSRGKHLIVKNSYFEGNYLIGGGSHGPAIMHAGSLDDAPGSTLLVENCTFYKNNCDEAGGYGTAIGLYDSRLGFQWSNVDIVEVKNSTFVENTSKDINQAAIDITQSPDTEIHIVNNTFYKGDAALCMNYNLEPVYIINNVMFTDRAAILSESSINGDGRDPVVEAYNNVIVGGERGVNEKMDDECFENATNYNNVIGTAAQYSIGDIGLSTTLTSENSIVPYLPITESGLLYGKGIANSETQIGINIVPTVDVRGYTRNQSNPSIGAFDPAATVGIYKNIANENKLFAVQNNEETITIKNNTERTVSVKITLLDGRTVYSTEIPDEVTLNKSELGAKGSLIIITGTAGAIKESKKVILF
ncbi:MAG: hypothetical protein LUG18_14460 [Candidatus Azobacteroides sp.]|nr:hypothetical protein [Candidatus Azobacteroides sp.]